MYLNRNWSLFLITNKSIENIYIGIELVGYVIELVGYVIELVGYIIP
jgi:hypothetical protein